MKKSCWIKIRESSTVNWKKKMKKKKFFTQITKMNVYSQQEGKVLQTKRKMKKNKEKKKDGKWKVFFFLYQNNKSRWEMHAWETKYCSCSCKFFIHSHTLFGWDVEYRKKSFTEVTNGWDLFVLIRLNAYLMFGTWNIKF